MTKQKLAKLALKNKDERLAKQVLAQDSTAIAAALKAATKQLDDAWIMLNKYNKQKAKTLEKATAVIEKLAKDLEMYG